MKRVDLVRHLEQQGCELLREGANHSVFVNRAARKTQRCRGIVRSTIFSPARSAATWKLRSRDLALSPESLHHKPQRTQAGRTTHIVPERLTNRASAAGICRPRRGYQPKGTRGRPRRQQAPVRRQAMRGSRVASREGGCWTRASPFRSPVAGNRRDPGAMLPADPEWALTQPTGTWARTPAMVEGWLA